MFLIAQRVWVQQLSPVVAYHDKYQIVFYLSSVYCSGDIMNKIICTLCLLVLSLFLTYCNGSNDNDTNTAESFENQQDIVQYKTYSLDEIYANGVFDENLITPA